MARSRTEASARLPHPFTYTPGDRHRYVWTDGEETIVVERIITGHGGRLRFERTGDTIALPDVRTASALADTVDRWRSAH